MEKKQSKLGQLFAGKQSKSEEMKEAKAVKTGKISPREYIKGEKMEGDKKSAKKLAKTANDIKSGKMSPKQYASRGR
jgi:hypothetical protein